MKTRALSLLVIFLVLCSIVLSKEQRQKAEWKGMIDIENGIKVIKNPGEPLYGEIMLELEEDLSIGREGDDNYIFYGLVAAAADSEDNIFVLDMENCRIQKYDKNGEYLQTIGRKGQGPGEFQMPQFISPYIHLDSDDTLYVQESRRIHAFDRKGNFKKVIKLSMNISFPFGITDEGNILAPATSRKGEEITRDIVFISSAEERIRTIASYPVHLAPMIRGRIMLGNPYAPRLTFCPLNKGRGV
ncbi:MAG: 6-bladed beta-propeller, partial [Candidatus Aminicenantes bacterium]